MKTLSILCPTCGLILDFAGGKWRCQRCDFEAIGSSHYADLLHRHYANKTGEHYSLQWGEELSFLEFVQNKPQVKRIMPADKLGWDDLFAQIKDRAKDKSLRVYDAACGFGGIAAELIDETTAAHLVYVGADIHNSLETILRQIEEFVRCGLLLRWNISDPLPIREKFDYVICRASLHHTPDPKATFSVLCRALKPGGTIAISVYNKKAVCREALDDALRAIVSKMPPKEAFAVCQQFTILGKALQQIQEKVSISEDLPLLGIEQGEYAVHSLIYYHFMKCFFNSEMGDQYSTLVNYDWYHPPFAYRYTIDEIKPWFDENNIEIEEVTSIDVQHYLRGTKKRGER